MEKTSEKLNLSKSTRHHLGLMELSHNRKTFLDLPDEIRNRIYEEVFSGNRLYMLGFTQPPNEKDDLVLSRTCRQFRQEFTTSYMNFLEKDRHPLSRPLYVPGDLPKLQEFLAVYDSPHSIVLDELEKRGVLIEVEIDDDATWGSPAEVGWIPTWSSPPYSILPLLRKLRERPGLNIHITFNQDRRPSALRDRDAAIFQSASAGGTLESLLVTGTSFRHRRHRTAV
ncbi:hypothetical protein BU23DRAFT_602649 [Bimuria novae-zelandiae CBS 107.79]|uniref:F-box domain-containing protein n=1 Tax=Bimuria novae-zelandiae CBS 107.79 TaxID=1447943 RepID=A0A6A5V364_9PLEO|nr:hypothetical protein BU23DRAFT_602649 [Bimuria novae-zelandiae CBS 107.79]